MCVQYKRPANSLIRDEDCCYRIAGIFAIVSSLSLCYHRLVLMFCACSYSDVHLYIFRCFTLSALQSLDLCAVLVTVYALHCAILLPLYIAF